MSIINLNNTTSVIRGINLKNMKNEKSQNKGHILARLGLDQVVLKYFGLRLDLRSEIFEFRKKLIDSAGLADSAKFNYIKEDVDRLEGMTNKTLSKKNPKE